MGNTDKHINNFFKNYMQIVKTIILNEFKNVTTIKNINDNNDKKINICISRLS